MKYYKSETCDSDLGEGFIYFEIDENDYVSRQIEIGEFCSKNSYRDLYYFESKFKVEEGIDLIISEEEFEVIWKTSLQETLSDWNLVKTNVPIGDIIIGEVKMFGRPVGRVLFDVNLGFFATGDAYSFNKEFGEQVKLLVTGFNDNFQWIEVDYVDHK